MKTFLVTLGMVAALATGGWTLAQAGEAGGEAPPCAPDGPQCRPCCK